MEEQDLDKISRLIGSITRKHGIDASYSVATYFNNPDLVYSVFTNGKNLSEKLHFNGTNTECIKYLEKIEREGLLPSRDDIVQCINRLEQTLADQKMILQRIEESKNAV